MTEATSSAVYAGTNLWADEPTASRYTDRRIPRETYLRCHAVRALQNGRSMLYAFRLADGIIKIGCSRDVARRINAYPGADILAFRFGDFEDEQALHRSLAASVARGREYYHPTPEVLAVVNEMRADFRLEALAS